MPVTISIPRESTFPGSDWTALSRHWHPVAFCHELGAAPIAVRLLDVRVVVWRTPDGVRAAPDLCQHRGASLSQGRVSGRDIVCPYHGYAFDPSGRCTHIPSQPDAVVPRKLCLNLFGCREQGGIVWVCLDPESTETPPEFPEAVDPAFQVVPVTPVIEWQASAGRQVESFCDVAHFAFVHPQTFAVKDPVVPRYEVRPGDRGLVAEFESHVGNVGDAGAERFRWRRVYHLHLPFTARLVVHFPGGGRLVILNAASPVSARFTRLFAVVARDFDHDKPVSDIVAFQHRVYGEDRAIVEGQHPEELPVDLHDEVHLRADRTSVEYRRLLARIGLGRHFTS
jgi:vanillate O-demethylase monooxygenase subunit